MKVILRRWKSHAGYTMQRKRINKFVVPVLVSAIVIMFSRLFLKGVVPQIVDMAEDNAETDVVLIIDDAIYGCKELENLRYEDIISVSYDESNQVTAVYANEVRLNRIRSALSREMNDKMNELNETKVYVPIGMLLGSKLFSGAGVRIPFKSEPYGTAYADFESSFESADINRTIHRINLVASASVAIVLPFGGNTLKVEKKVPIAETIIAGQVPNAYADINGLVKNETKN